LERRAHWSHRGDERELVIASKPANGVESNVYVESISISNPDGDTIAAISVLAAAVNGKVGTYVLRLVRVGMSSPKARSR